MLLTLTLFIVFDIYFIIYLPRELFDCQIFTKFTMSKASKFVKMFHINVSIIITSCAYKSKTLILFNAKCLYTYPNEVLAVWYIFLSIILSPDIHPNPGPTLANNNYVGSYFSFCNWNLNTLSKNEFNRVTLLEAHNNNFNYDIISLCETSLNDDIQVPENILPGYKFHSCNHPDGSRNGGVGIFYKESLPLRIRHDLSFDECIVTETKFRYKSIFFTVIYINPVNKALSNGFNKFLENIENLFIKIKVEKPYAMFFTGDFNAHSQTWYPEGDTNLEGVHLENLFSDFNLTQIIADPTHFFRDDCQPSCIDLIITDQPNIVLDSGTRSSLDPLVKHQIIFVK